MKKFIELLIIIVFIILVMIWSYIIYYAPESKDPVYFSAPQIFWFICTSILVCIAIFHMYIYMSLHDNTIQTIIKNQNKYADNADLTKLFKD